MSAASSAAEDVARAIITLAVDHDLLEPRAALQIVTNGRGSESKLARLLTEQVREVDVLQVLAAELGVAYYDLSDRQDLLVDDSVLERCDREALLEHKVLPMVNRNGQVVVVCADPFDVDAQAYMKALFRPEGIAAFMLADRAEVQSRLLGALSDFGGLGDIPPERVVPHWVELLLTKAVLDRASDLALRSTASGRLIVKLRVDSRWRTIAMPAELFGLEGEVIAALLNRCTGMDTTNLRELKDGTFSFAVTDRAIDARLSFAPIVAGRDLGANLTIRILDSAALRRRLEDMGFAPAHLEVMRRKAADPQGLILFVGPTGSGKSTTLYSLLREMDPAERNLITVEDPVEYRLQGVAQIQVRPDYGLTFAASLRSILRQAPDVILVGEIRDAETARTALDASQTGHLVLSTLHTRSAPGTFTRLIEMTMPPFLVADVISLIVSQRLLGKVHSCRTVGPPTDLQRQLLTAWGADDIEQVAHRSPGGCSGCGGTGFRGRVSAAELLAPSPEVREAVRRGIGGTDLEAIARRAGWRPILEDGIRHIRDLATTVEEVADHLLFDTADGDTADGDTADLDAAAPELAEAA